MNQKIKELLDRIRQIEDEIELEMERRRAELHIDFEKNAFGLSGKCWSNSAVLKWGCSNICAGQNYATLLQHPLYILYFSLCS